MFDRIIVTQTCCRKRTPQAWLKKHLCHTTPTVLRPSHSSLRMNLASGAAPALCRPSPPGVQIERGAEHHCITVGVVGFSHVGKSSLSELLPASHPMYFPLISVLYTVHVNPTYSIDQ